MHNGVFYSLTEVVDFYEKGGGNAPNKSPLLEKLQLSTQEKKDLVAFLESLSGDQVIVKAPELPGYPGSDHK
jgi:cytochrome c peroxidase